MHRVEPFRFFFHFSILTVPSPSWSVVRHVRKRNLRKDCIHTWTTFLHSFDTCVSAYAPITWNGKMAHAKDGSTHVNIYIYMYIHISAFLMDGLRPSNPVARSSIHSLQVLHSIPGMLLSITVSWIAQPTRKVRDILVCKFPCLQGSRAALKLSSMLHANSNVTANLDQYKNSNLNYKTMKQNSDNVPFQRHEKYIENHFELMGIS